MSEYIVNHFFTGELPIDRKKLTTELIKLNQAIDGTLDKAEMEYYKSIIDEEFQGIFDTMTEHDVLTMLFGLNDDNGDGLKSTDIKYTDDTIIL